MDKYKMCKNWLARKLQILRNFKIKYDAKNPRPIII